LLSHFGCELFQGYWFSEPVNGDKATSLITYSWEHALEEKVFSNQDSDIDSEREIHSQTHIESTWERS
jgi:c-di-GMP-related signal transduction protein